MTASRESATTYEAGDGSDVPMLVFEPGEDTQPSAGVVFFPGGALRKGSPDDLAPHCRQLASRAGYRLLGRGATAIADCVADVRRAIEHFKSLAASTCSPSHRSTSTASSRAPASLREGRLNTHRSSSCSRGTRRC
jgi:acetyl esterase